MKNSYYLVISQYFIEKMKYDNQIFSFYELLEAIFQKMFGVKIPSDMKLEHVESKMIFHGTFPDCEKKPVSGEVSFNLSSNDNMIVIFDMVWQDKEENNHNEVLEVVLDSSSDAYIILRNLGLGRITIETIAKGIYHKILEK